MAQVRRRQRTESLTRSTVTPLYLRGFSSNNKYLQIPLWEMKDNVYINICFPQKEDEMKRQKVLFFTFTTVTWPSQFDCCSLLWQLFSVLGHLNNLKCLICSS